MVSIHRSGVPLLELARSCRNKPDQADDGRSDPGRWWEAPSIAWSSFHHNLYGLTPQQFDAICSVPEPNPVAQAGSVDAIMITLQADFNHMDSHGRLRLEDLRMHSETPFAEIAGKHASIIFVDGDDMVRGELMHDPELGWLGKVDWSTQDVWESYPPAVAARR
jgi:hypothetical protein